MKIKTVYLAARYEWMGLMRQVVERLKDFDIEVTSRWVNGDCEGLSKAEAATIDLEDIARADALMCFADNHKGVGRHIELGYALGLGKLVFVVGESETVFHELPQVHIISDFCGIASYG